MTPSISLLVPFTVSPEDAPDRVRNWTWLREYWRHELPDAEVIVGQYDGIPFSKSSAVNDAALKATGDVLVILDADCYLDGKIITECARQITDAERRGRALWFIPYRHFHRLSEESSLALLQSDPAAPVRDFQHGTPHIAVHHYAAMIMAMSQEAFWQVGGMDERYCGWGGEDVSFMHALDTLYGRHRTTNDDVFHLHHVGVGDSWDTRRWSGQTQYMPLHRIAAEYVHARFDLARMRELVDGDQKLSSEYHRHRRHHRHRHHRHHHHNPYWEQGERAETLSS